MVSKVSKLVRETAMAVERSLGLIDEGRDLIERADQVTPTKKIKPIRCARCAADVPLLKRERVESQAVRELWTFECVSCGQGCSNLTYDDFADLRMNVPPRAAARFVGPMSAPLIRLLRHGLARRPLFQTGQRCARRSSSSGEGETLKAHPLASAWPRRLLHVPMPQPMIGPASPI